MSCASFERKMREGDQEENKEKFKADKVILCKLHLSTRNHFFKCKLQRGNPGRLGRAPWPTLASARAGSQAIVIIPGWDL